MKWLEWAQTFGVHEEAPPRGTAGPAAQPLVIESLQPPDNFDEDPPPKYLADSSGVITLNTERRRHPNLTEGAHIKFQRDAGRLWLRGYSITEISNKLGCGYDIVRTTIVILRDQLRELNKATMEEQAAKSIARLDMVQARAWEVLDEGAEPAKMLGVLIRAEETEARITGALSEKRVHSGSMDVVHKMYDFTDKFPPQVVDGEVTSLEAEDRDIVDRIPDEILPAVKDYDEFTTKRLSSRAPSKKLSRNGANGFLDPTTGDIFLEEEE
jgi:hypothetical protein